MEKYEVHVDDNFHYFDESYRFKEGDYETLEEAIARGKEIVDESLAVYYRHGMTGAQLWQCYKDYGPDPFLRGPDDVPYHEFFSAWKYAKLQCMEHLDSVKVRASSPEYAEIQNQHEELDTILAETLSSIDGVTLTSLRVKRH